MTETTVEIIPGPNLPTEFTARIAQPSQPTPSPIPPVGLVEIETAAQLIAGPPGPIGPVGPPGPQGSPDTAAQVLAKLVTVDGSGSGLDADLLDGHDSTYFATQSDMTAVQSTNTSQDTAIAGKVNKAGDTMTGPLILAANSTAPLKPPGDNTATIASTAFVQQEIAPKIGDAPNDGSAYERKGLAWVADPIQADAPNDGTQYVRKSLAWSPVSVPPGTAISDTPPASPQPGQMWWESDTGNLYIWYSDANSSQWVQVNSTGSATRAGQWDLLSTQTVSNAAAAIFDNCFPDPTVYDMLEYEMLITGIASEVTGNYPYMRMRSGGADLSSNYVWNLNYQGSGGSTTGSGSTAASQTGSALAFQNSTFTLTTAVGINLVRIRGPNPSGATKQTPWLFDAYLFTVSGGGTAQRVTGGGHYGSTVFDGVVFRCAGPQNWTGTAKMMGRRLS